MDSAEEDEDDEDIECSRNPKDANLSRMMVDDRIVEIVVFREGRTHAESRVREEREITKTLSDAGGVLNLRPMHVSGSCRDSQALPASAALLRLCIAYSFPDAPSGKALTYALQDRALSESGR